jgi:hypothetical protein
VSWSNLSWLGSTGQPLCQLPPSSAAVTADTVEEKVGGVVSVVGTPLVGPGTPVVVVELVDSTWRADVLDADPQPARVPSSSAIAMTPTARPPSLPAVTSKQPTSLRSEGLRDHLLADSGRRRLYVRPGERESPKTADRKTRSPTQPLRIEMQSAKSSNQNWNSNPSLEEITDEPHRLPVAEAVNADARRTVMIETP